MKHKLDFLQLTNCVVVPIDGEIWIQTMSETFSVTLEELKKVVEYVEKSRRNKSV